MKKKVSLKNGKKRKTVKIGVGGGEKEKRRRSYTMMLCSKADYIKREASRETFFPFFLPFFFR